jgi:hypothetical protein|nr:MAG TPA: helix-rich protein [Crassvirales sp.]
MSDILTGFNMQGNDPIDDRIVSKSNLETLEQYLNRVPVQKRYYGLTFFALDKNNELRKYTFQTSLIEPTIDDNEEEIERIDKELQEHVSNKAIHKTSEEIRSEIVDADIPDTIARVQWTLDQINTAVINLIGGASDEYNTLKRIQTKIKELRAEMESQLYGDDGGTVLKTLEQALKFLNQYKDFIVDIPDNFVSKQDIVDNLTTDDPTKVLSAKQGKILSDTLTNYFESAMQSIRTETDRAINAENRIEAKLDKEIERSTNEDIRIDNKLDSEINRSTAEDDRLDKKIDAETTRATTAESNLNTKIETETDRAEGEESRIETKLDNEITRSTNKDTEHDNRLQALEGQTHEQNTDLGTTNLTFQLKYNTGNKIKHESDAISVRNAADTDYVNFIAKNATFKGDLLVEGQSFVTEAETVEIKDNLLLLNKGEVGAGVTKGIAGLEIDRGTELNYQIIFDESDNRFKAGEIGDIQCLALRDGDDSMTSGMFTSWDSTTKRLKTTNIVPSSSFLYFGDNKTVSLNYSPINEGLLRINTNNQHLEIFTENTYTNFRSTRNKFQFIGDLYSTGTKYALTFKRSSDNSEVLYHADIINDLTTGGTNKVLSAEQGKLLQNSITSIQGSYLPLSGGTMTGSITFPNRKGIFGRLTDGTGNIKIAVVNANNNVEIGNSDIPLMLVSNSTDLTHYRDNNTYKIWDKFNLSDPATLSGNNTFTGSNIFSKTLKIGSQSVYSEINSDIGVSYHYEIDASVSRGYRIVLGNSIKYDFRFGGMFNGNLDTPDMYSYITTGQNTYITTPYKFYSNKFSVSNTMIVPESSFRIYTGNMTLLYYNKSNKNVQLGPSDSGMSLELLAQNLYYTKYDSASSTWKNYTIYSEYNLPNPVTYTTNAYNHATLKNKDGQYFAYIKAGTNGLLPHSKATLTSGGSGSLGTSDQSFNAAYINNLHTNKVTFGDAGPYITGSTSAIQFLNAEGGVQKVATGGLYVGVSYASDALNLVPANGIYSKGIIYIENGIGFRNSIWTNDLTPNRNYSGYLQVLDAYDAANAGGPTNYGTVLQINSRIDHWANQLWFGNNDNMYLRRMNYGSTTYGEWNRLLTNKDVNILPASYKNDPNSLPINQIFYAETHGVTGTPTDNGLLFSVQGNDEGIQLWAGANRTELYYRTKWTSYGGWIKLAATSDLNSYLTKTEASTLYYPYNGRGYLSITSTGKPVMSNNQGYAVKDKDGNEREVLWMGTDNSLNLGNTSQYTLNKLDLRCTTLTHNGKAIATQEYVNNRSVSWSNITGKPNTYTPSAHSHNSLQIEDNRDVTMLPNNMGPTTLRTFFNANKMPTSDWYSGIHISGWVTNYAAWQLCGPSSNNTTTASSLYFRSGKDSTWNSWKKIAFTSDIPTSTSHLTNDSGFITSSALNGYATQSWANGQYPLKTGTGASGTWDINISGNASTASAASKLGSTTIGGSAKPIYLSSGTPTACSATVGSATVPVYMNAGTITQCSTTLGVSITGNAATATNATQLGGTAASSYVKANDNISRLTNDSGYTTQEWVNGQGFLTSDSLLDKFVPTTGGYIRNSDQVLLRLQRTGVSTGTRRTIEMYFDDSNTDGTSTTPRGSIGYDSEAGMFLYSVASGKFLAIENTGKPFYGASGNRYYLLGSNTEYHNLDGYQRIGDIMIQWGYFTVQGNSTRAVNFPVSFTNTVWSVTGSWDNTTTSNQENWGFTDYTSSGFTIINGDGSSRVFHYIAIGPFTRS